MKLLLYFCCILTLYWTCCQAREIDDEIDQSDSHKGGKYNQVRALMGQYYRKSREKMGLSAEPLSAVPISQALPASYDDGTELSANREVLEDLFENDMVLTVDQIQGLLDNLGNRRGRRRHKRKIINGDYYRWKSTNIPYRFGISNENIKNYIRAGLRHWEKNTCLRFHENGNGKDYMNFIQGSGCYSNIGRTGGRQQVSIGQGCESLGIVAHEVGHALGFWHEQSRPDRDTYISVNFGNIITGTEGNFQKRSWQDIRNLGVPFDLGSVMHYGPKAFTMDYSRRTIDARNQNNKNTFGQRIQLSFTDIKQVNKVYCPNSCRNSLNCKHGGYPNPNRCNQCLCPEGLSGKCDRVASSRNNCGGDLRANSQWQTLKAPRLSTNQECNWRIQAPGNGKVLLQITKVNYPCKDTCNSFVEVKYNRDFQQTGPRFCCQRPSQIQSQKSEMVVLHRTDSQTGSGYSGFEARYRTDGGDSTWSSWTRTTPKPPKPTSRPKPTEKPWSGWNRWSNWGKWSHCSLTCGGCGVRTRRRACNGRCSGKAAQNGECGSKVCPTNGGTGTNGKCKGSIRLPCHMMRTLFSDSSQSDSFVNDLPHEQIQADPRDMPSRHRRQRRNRGRGRDRNNRRRQNGNRHPHSREWSTEVEETPDDFGWGRRGSRNGMCTKTFYYRCRRRDDNRFSHVRFDEDQDRQMASSKACCSGYVKQGNTCRRRRRWH